MDLDTTGMDLDQESKLAVLVDALSSAAEFMNGSVGSLDTGDDVDHELLPIRRFVSAMTMAGMEQLREWLHNDLGPEEVFLVLAENYGWILTIMFFAAQEYGKNTYKTKE